MMERRILSSTHRYWKGKSFSFSITLLATMNLLGMLFLPALLAGPLLSLVALATAYRHGRGAALDLATLLAPPILFFVVGCTREELRMGWALILWPVLLFASCGYLLVAKIWVIDRWASPIASSRILFLLTLLSALALAVNVPQLLE